jgi:hypothetical protein
VEEAVLVQQFLVEKELSSYSSSLSRKKQYEHPRLQMAPVGFDNTWKPGDHAGAGGPCSPR